MFKPTGINSTISAHRNPNYFSIQLEAKSNKNIVQQKGQRIVFLVRLFQLERKQRYGRH